MEHSREVKQIEDYLGSLAGLFDLFVAIISFFIGKYCDFMSKLSWVENLYTFKVTKPLHKDLSKVDETGKLALSRLEKVSIYLMNFSWF